MDECAPAVVAASSSASSELAAPSTSVVPRAAGKLSAQDRKPVRMRAAVRSPNRYPSSKAHG